MDVTYLGTLHRFVMVDHVLIPMNVGQHWILARFDIKCWALFVYNSLRSGVDDAKVMCEMQWMAVVIPYLLMLPYFYDKQSKVDHNSLAYKDKELDAPLDVFFIDGLSQQTEW